MNKKIIMFLGIMVIMATIVMAATPTLITKFSVKEVSYAAKIAPVESNETGERNVTFLCDGVPSYVRVSAVDVRDGYDDEFKSDSVYNCNGVITKIFDWNGKQLKEYGNESIGIKKTFDEVKGKKFDCTQKGHNWTGVDCKTIIAEVIEEDPIELGE